MTSNTYKKKNIGVNAILNTIRSCMSLIFPLITYPYAARVLGVDNLGKVNFGSSIVAYFSLLAALGASTYAVRTGSQIRSNRKSINRFASQIFTINLLTTAIAYFLLILGVSFIPQLIPYRALILIQGVGFIFTTIGIDWVNTIFEDYYIVTIRTLFSYLIGIVLLFVFVRDSNDYYQYAIIQLMPAFLTAVLNWLYCRRYVKIRIVRRLNLMTHIKPLLTFFANLVAIQIYVNVDTTMLGWMQGDYPVGLYAMSVKIYTIVKNLLVSVYAVTVPRLSKYFGQKDYRSYRKLFTQISSTVIILLLPASFGVVSVAGEIIYLIGGSEYAEAVLSLQILGIALVFAIFGGLTTAVLNVTTCREGENLKATVIGAVINAGLNIVLIPRFSQNGAAVTTAIAEAVVFLYCFIRYPNKRRYLNLKAISKNLVHSLIGSISVVFISLLFHSIQMHQIIRLFCIVGVSVIVYFGELVLLKNEVLGFIVLHRLPYKK